MRARTLLLIPLLAALAAGCAGRQRAEKLRQEIKALEDARIETKILDREKGEAEAAERKLAETQAAHDALVEHVAALERESARLDAALQREIDRNEGLRSKIESGRQDIEAAMKQQARLDDQVKTRRQNAQIVRDQADALTRELRPGDPAWATKRRLVVLRDFLERVSREYPQDPELAALAEGAAPAVSADAHSDPAEQARLGSALARRVRDRMATVYGLGEEGGSGSAGGGAGGAPAGES